MSVIRVLSLSSLSLSLSEAEEAEEGVCDIPQSRHREVDIVGLQRRGWSRNRTRANQRREEKQRGWKKNSGQPHEEVQKGRIAIVTGIFFSLGISLVFLDFYVSAPMKQSVHSLHRCHSIGAWGFAGIPG